MASNSNATDPTPDMHSAQRPRHRSETNGSFGNRVARSNPTSSPVQTRRAGAKEGKDLVRLADQLQALAIELRQSEPTQASGRSRTEPGDQFSAPTDRTRGHFLDLARSRYDARRRRSAAFEGAELFGEPAWDILLDLYIAFAEGKHVSVSSACIGSAAPPTTGLRWLGVLQDAGLVEREHDPRDQRRVLVRLTQEGIAKMEAYFNEAVQLDRGRW